MDRLPLTLSPTSGVPYYRQVEDQIAALVRAGTLPPGERLPSVRELAAALPVSLITVRRAYSDLEQAGLIVLRQGQGTFVADDVTVAGRRWAEAEGRRLLVDATAAARRLGLDDGAIRMAVEAALTDGGTDGD